MRLTRWRAAPWRAPAGGAQDAAAGGGDRSSPAAVPVAGARARAWVWYLAAGVLACALYLVIPLLPISASDADLTQVAIYWLVGLSAAAAIAVAIRLHGPPTARAWSLLATGVLSWSLADVTFDCLRLFTGTAPYPSAADMLYLLGYPLIAAGLLILVGARAQGRERTGLIDALIVATGLGVLVWEVLLRPSVSDPTMTVGAELVSVVYPLMDLLLLATAVRLVVGRARSTPALLLLLAGLCAQLFADVGYAVLGFGTGYHAGGALDLAWLGAYLLLATAALHPSMVTLTEPRVCRVTTLSRPRVGLLVGSALVPAIALTLKHHDGKAPGFETPLLAGAVTLLGVLVFIRVSTLAAQLGAHARTNERLLDEAVRSAEEQRAQIAVDIHDGPIQRLAGVGITTELARRRVEKGRTAEALDLLDQLGDDVSEEILALRQIMVDLHPPILAEAGLPAALRALGEEFARRTGIHCVQRSDPVNLDPTREKVLYRVAQEALANVAKHAHASTVWLTLAREGGTVKLIVLDDGEGFVTKERAKRVEPGRYGVDGMRRRAEMAGGTFRIRSRPGAGTMVLVTVPCPATA